MPRRTNPNNAQSHALAESMSRLEAREIVDAGVQARKRAGMTQAKVAKEMGISESGFARLERAATLLSMRTLQRFARATSSRLHLPIDPVSNHDNRTASCTVTDTIIRSGFSTDRRNLLGGAIGLAGMLGLSNLRQVSAQEATAAATAIPDYVWTPPDWGEERSLFTVIEQGEEITLVETVDGRIEAPSSPQRIVSLNDEYVALSELGLAGKIVARTENPNLGKFLRAGDLTDAMHDALVDVPLVGTAFEPDVERVISVSPDLILGNTDTDLFNTLSEVASYVREPVRVTDAPRAAIRDFGALLGESDTAAQVLADHEAYVARAREAVAPVIEGKRVLVMEFWPDSNELQLTPSYFLSDGSPAVLSLGYPFFRELGFTPTNFVELLAEQNDRDMFFYVASLEQLGNIDADMVFFSGPEDQYRTFLDNPIVQSVPAFQNDAIYIYDREGYGFGLAGVRAAVKGIVETVTGEPFE